KAAIEKKTLLIEIPAINQARLIASEPNKPSPAPKPRLSPKPFAVERNPTIKPILAPKPQPKPRPESTLLPGHKPEPPSNPKPLQPAASVKARLASSNPNRPAPTSFKTSNKLNAGQTTKPIAHPTKAETAVPTPRWAGRRPLSADLTSKFESIGLSLHRKSLKADAQENAAEEKSPALKREQDRITPQRSKTAARETDSDDDKRGASIKSRISLLLDSSSSLGPTGQGSDFPSPVQPSPETESALGVKMLIKQLTEDTTPTQSAVMKPSLEKDRHREVDLRSALDEQRKEEMLDTQKKRDLQKETERHMAKLKELEMEKQAHREFARMKELEMQREAERQRQKVFEKQKREMEEKQRALEMQKQIELEKQRLQEAEEKLKLERERQWQSERMQERERQRERERQKQREEERQRELDKERRLLEIQKEKQKMEEMEKLKEQERQQLLEIQKQKQREKERQQAVELEKQRLREKLEREQAEKMKQMALEQEMLRIRELDKEKERQKEMERERQKEIEREKQRQEQERQLMELQKQRQREKERQQQIELENQRLREKKEREEAEKIRQMALEQEMLRMRELEKEKERQKEMERERQREIEREKQRALEQQRQRDLERERQRQLDIERQEMENQRLRQKEQEKEKKRLEDLERLKEMERQQLLEFDKQKQAERDRQQIMELEKRRLKMEEMEKLKEQERQQFLEIQKQKQREKERQQAIELEKQRLREKLEREQAEKMRQIAKQQEAERHRLKEKQRKEEQERLRQESAPMRPKVLDLDSVLRKEPLVKATAQRSDPANRWKEPYKPGILDIDSFSPLTQHSPGKDLFPVSSTQGLDSDFGTRSQHTPERDVSWKAPPQTSGSFSSPVWTAGPQDPWELQPVEMSVDKPAADPRKHVSKPSAESLLFRQDEQPWTPQRSWTPVQDEPLHSAPFSGTEAGTANTPSGLSGSSSMEYSWLPRELQPQESRGAAHHQRRSQGSQAPTALLDTSVLRSRAQLGKKRGPRTRPSRAARQTTRLAEKETSEDWLYRDSTDAKPERKEDDSDSEEQTRGAESSPAVALQPQRVALFPGMDPSALKAQLRRRGDSDNQVDGAAASPSQLSRSPKSPFLPRAARVLPPPGGKENGEEDSPQWLKELKSKKRLSQYESES
uniref:Zinc finger CCCH domain-containing protein 13-like n=1 Tax=Salarias fasciatus TaxID=181472 RepID=A0A672JB33_SALFA